MITCPAGRDERHDAMIRLFQDTIEVLLLRDLPPVIADSVRAQAERAWLDDLSVLTGLAAATGVAELGGGAQAGRSRRSPSIPRRGGSRNFVRRTTTLRRPGLD